MRPPARTANNPFSLVMGGLVTVGVVALTAGGAFEVAVALALALGLAALALWGSERVGTGAVILSAFLAPMKSLTPSASVSAVSFADVFLVIGFGLLIPQLTTNREKAPILFKIGALGLVLMGAMSCLAAVHPGASLYGYGRLVFSAVLLPLAFLAWRPRGRIVVALAGAYVTGSAVSLLYGLVAHVKSVDGRYAGLTNQPNELGLTALFSLALIPFLLRVTAPNHRWICYVLALANVGAVWASGSRGALLVTGVLAVAYPLIGRSFKALGWLLFAVAIGISMSGDLLNTQGGNALGRLLGSGSSSDSNASRLQRVGNALNTVKDHPILGSGFSDALIAHVTYLEVLAGGGLICAAGFCMILAATDAPLFRARQPFNLLAYPAVAYTLVGLVTNVLWERYIWVPVSLALLARPPQPIDDGERHHESAPLATRVGT